MDFSTYQQLASRTMNPALGREETLQHALYMCCAEIGEVHSLFQKKYQGHDINREHLVKEIGDVLWGLAELCTVCNINMDEVARTNIEKLLERYPNGFEVDKSLNRREGDI